VLVQAPVQFLHRHAGTAFGAKARVQCLPHLREYQFHGSIAAMVKFSALVSLVLVLVSVASCGGSEDDGDKASSCGSFTACGGSIDGTWQIDGTCMAGDLAAALKSGMNLPSACSDLITSVTQVTTGSVTFASGTETNNVTTTVTERINYTSACVSAMTKQNVVLDASACSQLQSSVSSSTSGASATCALVGNSCGCSVTLTSADTSTSTYTVSGNTLVPGDGTDPVSYCVSGSTLKITQASSDLPGMTLFVTLHNAS
jgi:hypothetical protein